MQLLFLLVLVFVSIIFNIFQGLGNILNYIMFPFDFLFSHLQTHIESRKFNSEQFQNTVKSFEKQQIFIIESKDPKNVDFTIPYGIISKETNRNLTVIANSEDVKKNYIVVDETGILLGFVEEIYSNRILVRKLGWGNGSFFGKIGNVDVLVREHRGNLFAEIPDNYTIPEEILQIEFPSYITKIKDENKNGILIGNIVSKFGEMYLFEPIKSKNFLVYFFPF
ncbi:hypothetical protein [Petrotoga sp. 9PWA.NaAc.5.4]|uniref:hypothetical protein n=1 Tax=Petrotoga sp. 9PWA.NaAc.5.4 TaxID=1434328 RepID=UPI000CB1F653|nr:hypothetical protein [Petrotoga sp. 9PWA.NaAc.5.4]PNR97216.1 hypothetical protein X924_00780 [Petrotoga sp. 9PWA.NaAc.5.4]